ncbi:hypothetical protein GTA08_BOTSDO10949 [Neofusicoccum parvum]|uniref:Uncharacterized protein n=1 Tax=Neofusicoccum parvum TaxID=310453 RepID=A0ACB5S6L1_9PEZI|nr:hypothetical protein GTA08_BOTSDO10949 [Neofusicoccum parvum]
MEAELDQVLKSAKQALQAFEGPLAQDVDAATRISQTITSQSAALRTKIEDTVQVLNKLQQLLTPPQNILMDALFGATNTKVLYCAAHYRFADILQTSPLTGPALASQAGIDGGACQQLVRYLLELGFFTYDSSTALLSNNAASDLLRSDHWTTWHACIPQYADQHYSILARLPDAVAAAADGNSKQQRRTAAQLFHGSDEPLYAIMERTGATAAFHRAIGAFGVAEAPGLLGDYPWAEVGGELVTDVGCGRGDFAVGYLRAFPAARAAVFELPETAALVRRRVEGGDGEGGVRERLEVFEGDFYEDALPRSAVYFLKWVFHNWDDEHCVKLLRRLREAIVVKPGVSRVLVVETVIREGRQGSFARYADIRMLAQLNNRERTLEEYRDIARKGGFEIHDIITPRGCLTQVLDLRPNTFQPLEGQPLSFPVDLVPLFNNRAFGLVPNESDFDGTGSSYPADSIPPPSFVYSGFNYQFPEYQKAGNDNVIAIGQTVSVPRGKYINVAMLAASESGIASSTINASYADDSQASDAVLVPAWWNWPYPAGGDIVLPYRLTNETVDYNRSNIFQAIGWLDSSKELTSLTLPNVTGGSNSSGVETVTNGTVKRLRNGDQTFVEIGVTNKAGVEPGTAGNATVYIAGEGIPSSQYTFNATFGIADFEATYDSVYAHETPNWFNDAKYGIFIHWGVYSVPGWGNSGENESYAEWYWWDQNQGPGTDVGTWEYHLDTYGPDVVYDDFIQNFTASAFDPKEWVDLFADAGANYFVQVSKHHDGYAIFDLPANVSQRTSVALTPHRNLLQELFDAAETYQPQLHRAVYYSLPEWFHPDYAPLGFGDWPGGNATNPYTNVTLPYTGYVPVADYITDVIVPEMDTLAAMGTEVMWCDIGGPNVTAEWASAWFNAAAAQGRQVAMNARCGLPGDFDTPEYARYAGVQARKWESNLGMDPYSYGYNRATPAGAYMNASTIARSLVDIASKNGNFLLDVGPMQDGTILEVEQRNLREAGRWIKAHGEAVFGTRYWSVTPQEGESVRFTTTADAFYVLLLERPGGEVVLESPVPWVEGDEVVVVGGSMNGTVVPSRVGEGGAVVLEVAGEVADADEFVWVFKIPY